MKKNSLLFVLMLSIFLISVPAHAEEATAEATATPTPATTTVTPSTIRGLRATIKQEREETKETIKASREANLEEKCKQIEARVEEKTTKFDDNKAANQARYTEMKERLAHISAQLKLKGLDTTKLDTDIATLNTKTDKFVTDFTAYIDKLKATKTFACGHSDGEFRTALQAARTAILPVRQDVLDIRSFYQTTIRPDLISLRTQLAKIEPTLKAGTTEPTGSASVSATPAVAQ